MLKPDNTLRPVSAAPLPGDDVVDSTLQDFERSVENSLLELDSEDEDDTPNMLACYLVPLPMFNVQFPLFSLTVYSLSCLRLFYHTFAPSTQSHCIVISISPMI